LGAVDDADADAKGLAIEAKKLGGVKAYPDYKVMLAEAKPDIAAICARHIHEHRDMIVAAIEAGENGATQVTITGADGSSVTDTVPAGPSLIVAVGDSIAAGAPLTNDPNVGGFGQLDAEVVLQNPVRIYGMLAFFAAIAMAQILLVLKKRQVEKVQAAEGI
jgi:hypothetical protein